MKYRLFINGPYAASYEEDVDVVEEWGLDPSSPDFEKDLEELTRDWFHNHVEYGATPVSMRKSTEHSRDISEGINSDTD